MKITLYKKVSIKDMTLSALIAAMAILLHFLTNLMGPIAFGFVRLSFDWPLYFLILYIMGYSWSLIVVFLLDLINLMISGGMGTWRWYFAIAPLIAISLFYVFNNLFVDVFKYKNLGLLIAILIVYLIGSCFWGTGSVIYFLNAELNSSNFLKFFVPRIIMWVPKSLFCWVIINCYMAVKNHRYHL